MRRKVEFYLLGVLILFSCSQQKDQHKAILPSPDFDIHLYFNLYDGYPYYMVYHYNQKVVEWSLLGFSPEQGPAFNENMQIESQITNKIELEYNGRANEEFWIGKLFNSISFELISAEIPGISYFIDFRAYDGGVAYRYRFPERDIMETIGVFESSEFNLNQAGMQWDIETRQGMGDSTDQSLILPMSILSQNSYKVIVAETSDHDHAQLIQADKKIPSFIIKTDPNGSGLDFSSLVTPWRVLIISKNN